jgi:type 1 fimbria pilin
MKLRLISTRLISTVVTACATLPLLISSAQAQATASVNSASPVVTLQGNAGSATCGTAAIDKPQHTVDMTEDSDRRFRVKGDSETTLLLINSQGKRFCIQTDSYSNGEAELTGRWTRGTYKVFVGSRSASKPAYKLSVLPLN